MEIEVSCSTHDNRVDMDSIRVKRKTLQNLLEDCQRALELLDDETGNSQDRVGEESEGSDREELSSSDPSDPEADQVCLFLHSLSLSTLI